MKNVLIIIMVLSGFAINAQNKPSGKKAQSKEMKQDLNPEQRAELKTKKMTLQLDLNDSQQKKVKQLFLTMDQDRPERPENVKEMTSEQKYAAKNAMLDRRIAFKKQMKEILSEQQLAKWEQGLKDHKGKGKKKQREQLRD